MPSMSSLSARLFGEVNPKRCDCGCLLSQTHFAPPKWFPRIRRRSSASSASSSPDTLSPEQRLQDEFEHLYQLAQDEMAYAFESQGSIYYGGDLVAAKEAVDSCLVRYHHLVQHLDHESSMQFDAEWAAALASLRTRLDTLPLA